VRLVIVGSNTVLFVPWFSLSPWRWRSLETFHRASLVSIKAPRLAGSGAGVLPPEPGQTQYIRAVPMH
jgi:hypothetical protein